MRIFLMTLYIYRIWEQLISLRSAKQNQISTDHKSNIPMISYHDMQNEKTQAVLSYRVCGQKCSLDDIDWSIIIPQGIASLINN